MNDTRIKIAFSLRFNRNIVECKVISEHVAVVSRQGFNRNIVECKGCHSLLLTMVHVRFNRNIVECKEVYCRRYRSREKVLIETLWNVKEGPGGHRWTRAGVLIETLWNVKAGRLDLFRQRNQF